MVQVGGKRLSLEDFSAIIFDKQSIEIDPVAADKVQASHRFLQDFSGQKLIYGINTGFGPMAQYKVSQENILQLQYNLIRSHSSGAGGIMPAQLAKAVMVARLNSLLQGYSGVHPDLTNLLAGMINKDLIPCIYEHGGVGASGDLVQLAHLGLALIGEGDVWYENKIQPAADAFRKAGLVPLKIHIREGLAVLNGTSAMTGIGMLNIFRAKRLLHWSVMLSALTNELMEAYNDHFSAELNIVKHHRGQNHIAAMFRSVVKDSGMIRSRSEHLYNPDNIKHDVFEDKVQEYYSLRCVTQVLGPVFDTLVHAEQTVTDELNSANDNPIVDVANQNIFHGGNFHGDYVSLEMDKVKIAITKLSMLSERQLNYLLNSKLNQKFPPFVNLGVLGFNFGMQGVQFTATSTVAENQTLSFPMYVHSIPNNNDNQDIVSMGCNAALMTRKVVENSYEVLAIQAMSLLQAVDYLKCEQRLATDTRAVYTKLRALFPVFVEDQPRYQDIKNVKHYLENHEPFTAAGL
ncbi:MAG: histidine ammonia-lyase [Sphingobacteriales bacterium SCN 48-20]|jgi:histidine ammonia-lyase|uniref:HAL/PAL/TAL family ammonia-lyase n=1 Tax=Terrimonas ferruginea TaxID=249 RepID=UPI0008691F80|nr:aromatic amino acid ammonia-lyase [Terrimonas ferruginea]MBN8784510.1 aromatic amino acid lyase [Terrimonas ferruginea]ODT94686.1 MAG: histidine ammonia-lyase [Sphingobacteriales bacterium SCN 48-20]OJW40538.1 MAG: histidine ammonia-lyase [Sphingobacteriales bacterium 48-107]